MSSNENADEQGMKDDPPEQPLTSERATVLQQLKRFQSDIEGQSQRVVMAVNPIAEVLDSGGNVPLEMINHVKAQILKAHLQLDDLEQLLTSMGW